MSLKHGDIRLFGLCISFGFREKIRELKLSAPSCKVKKHDDGFLYLYDMSGNKLPHQISLELFDGVNKCPKAKVELCVDISEL